MLDTKIVQEAENFVRHIFRSNNSKDNFYHDLKHTEEVAEGVKDIGKATGLTDTELEIALIAAWFHDTGYFRDENNHEEESAELARSFLAGHDYPEKKIEEVASAIMATKVPQKPQNELQKVLCDADLLHVGKKNFFEKNELFRIEQERKNEKMINEYDWIEDNIEFLTNHQFFTRYAKNKFEEQKNEHLLKLQKKLRKQKQKAEKRELREAKIEIDKEKLEKKKKIDKQASRGIETMFRNVMRTHVNFSEMADNKANIMISVNTIIITIIVSIMARKLDANPHLIIPTVMLTTVSLVTIVFAILVTRPNITEGTFSKDDIREKKANLLFFGNFYNMKLNDFSWGMEQMINDRDYLYGSMIKDFYSLGQVLGKKYHYLRVCYTIFMYGLIASVLAYAIALILHPGTTELGSIIE